VTTAQAPDIESQSWVASLSGTGPGREDAVHRLHELLVRAAHAEVARRAGTYAGTRDLDDLAAKAADDALVAILAKLHTYRGDSRFTTWACKFALLEAAVRMRRRSWHGRELPLEADGWERLSDARMTSPDDRAETCELIDALCDGIGALTSHQRSVLIALAVNGVPIDVLAERRQTTRGALYMTLRDARRRLRARLAVDGLEPDRQRKRLDVDGGKNPPPRGAKAA
jgi:RNA polymerase sigma-70 factor, ECF subfamily